MEREGILRSYEKKGDSKGPIRKYYSIVASRTFLVTVAPNIFQYKSLDLNAPEGFGRFEIKLDELDKSPENLHSMIAAFINANRKLDQIVEVLKDVLKRSWRRDPVCYSTLFAPLREGYS